MPWSALEEFPIVGTNIPIEWLDRLRFSKSFASVQEYLGREENLRARADALRTALRKHAFPPELKGEWMELIRCLAKRGDLSKHFSLTERDRSLSDELRDEIIRWQSEFQTHKNSIDAIRAAFDAELAEKRKELWSLASDPRFQEAVFCLSPDFLERVKQYIPLWSTRNRDNQMRKRENSIASYLARFCAKNSVSGPMGPTFKGLFSATNPDPLSFGWLDENQNLNGIAKRVTYFTHWGAQALADKMAENYTLRLSLPLRLHPLAFVNENEVVASLSNPNHEFLPKIGRAQLSERLRDLLGLFDGRTSAALLVRQRISDERGREELSSELFTLLSDRLLLDGLILPPGIAHPLAYLENLLSAGDPENSEISRWREILHRFQSLVDAYSAAKVLDDKIQLFGRLEDLFREFTAKEPRRGAGDYYADRFLIYEDCERASSPLVLGKAVSDEILESYSLALELLTPLWLFTLIPTFFFTRRFLDQLCKEHPKGMNLPDARQKLSDLGTQLARMIGQPCPKELKEDDEVSEWLAQIADLASQAAQILAPEGVDKNLSEIVLSPDDPQIQEFRKQCHELLAESPRLPVYASGPIIQLAAVSLEALKNGQFQVIFDSVIFGNSMHLTAIGRLATDLQNQRRATEKAMMKIASAGEGRLAHFLHVPRQLSKFTPWIGAGVDIEFMGPSGKEEDDRITLREVIFDPQPPNPLRRKNTPLHLDTSNTVRLSRKLLHERFQGHFPRIRIGKSVLQRENWKIPSKEFPSLNAEDPFLTFLETVRVQRRWGLPDFVFVDPSGPGKNILIDFQSYLSIEVLLNLASTSDELRFSEMLPSPEQFWLRRPDAKGSFTVGLMPFIYFDAAADASDS